ncbi:hypothetical protein Q5691_18280 [Microcoleus sp. w1-18aA5]|uniref:hypothetical protein n=1 Tax=Microcoleus sp. w1-18aA5 TaxID=2818982 RepID=UPI002FD0E0AF
MSFNEGRGKREEGRRKKEEGRRKKGEGRGKKENFFPSPTLPISPSPTLPISPSPTLSPPLPLSPVTTVRILPIKCFNYFCLKVNSRKKFMKNQEKSVILVFYFLLKK